jgi:hypothetical protein
MLAEEEHVKAPIINSFISFDLGESRIGYRYPYCAEKSSRNAGCVAHALRKVPNTKSLDETTSVTA